MSPPVGLDEIPGGRVYDYCVIGAGPAGLIASRELSKSGSAILLEAGSDDARRSYEALRAETTDSLLITGSHAYPANPWTLKSPGGGMERYAGILFRFRREDFSRSGAFPSATSNPDWPFGYEELRPFYDELEHELGIARRGAADPTEPPSPHPVMPPHEPSPQAARINLAFEKLGLRHFATPLGINSRNYADRPPCSHCGYCNGLACASGAKASLLRVPPREGEAEPDLTLVRSAYVDQIHVDATGRATSVECVNTATGARRGVRARVFVVAAGALNTCALLLRSTSPSHPHGIGNSRNQVGGGVQFKLSGYATTYDPTLQHIGAEPTLFSTTATTDLYHELADGRCGGLIYEATVPGNPLAVRLHFVVSESPMLDNRVIPARSGLARGPNVIIRHEYGPDDVSRLRALRSVSRSILAQVAPVVEVVEEPNSTGRAHLAGGCRSGDDPRTSVVDRSGRVHECDNVYVADSAFFPYTASVNPTFTIIANALRISRGIPAVTRSCQ